MDVAGGMSASPKKQVALVMLELLASELGIVEKQVPKKQQAKATKEAKATDEEAKAAEEAATAPLVALLDM